MIRKIAVMFVIQILSVSLSNQILVQNHIYVCVYISMKNGIL